MFRQNLPKLLDLPRNTAGGMESQSNYQEDNRRYPQRKQGKINFMFYISKIFTLVIAEARLEVSVKGEIRSPT